MPSPSSILNIVDLARVRMIADGSHRGQLDRLGVPYVDHVERVAARTAEAGGGVQQQMAALLHGVIEHTNTSLEHLARRGLRPRLLAVIDALTQRPYEHLERHLRRVAACPPAILVKRCDILENARLAESEGSGLRRVQADALAYLDLPELTEGSVETLLAIVSDDRHASWWYAVSATGRLGSDRGLPALIAAMERHEDHVQSREPGSMPARTPADYERVHHLQTALMRFFTGSHSLTSGPPPGHGWIPLLEEFAEHHLAELRFIGVELLGRMRDASRVRSFIEALGDDSVSVWAAAMRAAGRTGSELAYEPLARILMNSDVPSWKRRSTAAALGEIGDRRARPHLVTVLSQPQMADAAARSLLRLEDPGMLPAVREHLRSGAWGRREAAWILGEMRDAQAVDALVNALRDTNSQVAEYAAQALGKIGPTEETTSPACIEALAEASRSGSIGLRWTALWALERIGPWLAIEALLEACDDPSPAVRERAIRALARSEDERATMQLMASLPTASGLLARPIVRALARSADPRATPALLAALIGTTDRRTRNLTGRALASIGVGGTTLIHHHDAKIRRVAAWVEGHTRREPPSGTFLRWAIRDRDETVRQRAAVGLGRVGGPDAIDGLASALKDPSPRVRAGAASALGKLGLEAGLQYLEAALNDENASVRSAALASQNVLRRSST